MKRKQAKLDTSVSSECFRLLRLTQEVQSDVKVLKPIVDEVDVLRLCRVLGMTLSDEDDQVAKYNFEFGQFQPSDYDADFSRFVRDKLKATNEDDEHQLHVGCLFGKQLDVKEELVRMGYWRKCEEGLFFHNQGVFCIIGEGSPTQLVVFTWLDASLFEPEAIRSTPAYVLRFLTSLSSSITCCLGEDDFRLLKRGMDMEPNSNSKWKSCSFAFRVQKQVDQKDNIACGSISKTQLPRTNETKAAWFVGGTFPVVAVERWMPSTSEWVSHHDIIPCESFGKWLMQKKSGGSLIELPIITMASRRDHLLHQFGQFPEEELGALQTKLSKELEEAKERIYSDICKSTTKVYDEAIQDACFLFSVKSPANSEQVDRVQKHYDSLLRAWEQNGVAKMVSTDVQLMLYLPRRVQAQMKDLEHVFLHHTLEFEDALNAVVKGDCIDPDDSSGYWFLDAARRWLRNDRFSSQFGFEMQEQESKLTDFWTNAVKTVVSAMQQAKFDHCVEEFANKQKRRYDQEEELVLQKAYENFREFLKSGEEHLSIKISRLWWVANGDKLSITWRGGGERTTQGRMVASIESRRQSYRGFGDSEIQSGTEIARTGNSKARPRSCNSSGG